MSRSRRVFLSCATPASRGQLTLTAIWLSDPSSYGRPGRSAACSATRLTLPPLYALTLAVQHIRRTDASPIRSLNGSPTRGSAQSGSPSDFRHRGDGDRRSTDEGWGIYRDRDTHLYFTLQLVDNFANIVTLPPEGSPRVLWYNTTLLASPQHRGLEHCYTTGPTLPPPHALMFTPLLIQTSDAIPNLAHTDG